MSARIELLRTALGELLGQIDASHNGGADTAAFGAALAKARYALVRTRFVPPSTFPVDVVTRCGIAVTLVAAHDGKLIGTRIDDDGGRSAVADLWNTDGSYFGPHDPDEMDLAIPADAPFGPELAGMVMATVFPDIHSFAHRGAL